MINISWKLSKPLSTAKLFDPANDTFVNIPDDLWKQKVAVRKGDHVALLYSGEGTVLLTAPIHGSTLHHVLRTIEKGMHKPLTTQSEIEVAYRMIGWFLRSSDRRKLVKKLEQKKLTPADLVQDNYEFFEGHLRRKGNVWIYAVGS